MLMKRLSSFTKAHSCWSANGSEQSCRHAPWTITRVCDAQPAKTNVAVVRVRRNDWRRVRRNGSPSGWLKSTCSSPPNARKQARRSLR